MKKHIPEISTFKLHDDKKNCTSFSVGTKDVEAVLSIIPHTLKSIMTATIASEENGETTFFFSCSPAEYFEKLA